MQLKDLLNEYKCRMSVTNDYIAEHVGVNKSTVSRWMKGETKVMKPAVIEKLSYLLGTDVESLLKNSDRFEKPLEQQRPDMDYLQKKTWQAMRRYQRAIIIGAIIFFASAVTP